MTIANDDLINAAREARRNAYNRYSNFAVGAALIDDKGHLHVGFNVENAAYPLGTCAEAGAIAAMVRQENRKDSRDRGNGRCRPLHPLRRLPPAHSRVR